MTADPVERLARLEERTKNIEGWLQKLDANQVEILTAFHEARGGWKTVLLIAGVSGVMGALALKVAPLLGLVK